MTDHRCWWLWRWHGTGRRRAARVAGGGAEAREAVAGHRTAGPARASLAGDGAGGVAHRCARAHKRA